MPAAISGDSHSIVATRGRAVLSPRFLRHRVHAVAHAVDKLSCPLRRAERRGHSLDVSKDIAEIPGGERHQGRFWQGPIGQGRAHLVQAHGADFALNLRHDVRGSEMSQSLCVHAVDREALRQELLDLAMDFVRRALDVHLGLGADREFFDLGRKVAFVRAPDELPREAERRDDFRRAREKRDDPRRRHRQARFSTAAASGPPATKSAKTNPSRSTTAPLTTSSARVNIGPPVTQV